MNKQDKLTKDTFNPEAFTYVDLGLPSGRLWATENAPGFYTYDEAVDTFGELLPKGSAIVELIEESTCIWNDEKKGLDITGPNGTQIFLPADGFTLNTSEVKLKSLEGNYWTRMPLIQIQAARHLFFNSDIMHPLDGIRRRIGLSVRPCRELH